MRFDVVTLFPELVRGATAEGVLVTESTAAGLSSGLAAGIYPPGSALYAVPPAGQLSLFQEAQDRRALALATELVMTRIDGSVTNIITGIVPPEMASVYALQQGPAIGVVLGEVQSTVIGSVNTGEIVTHVDVTASLGQMGGGIDLALPDCLYRILGQRGFDQFDRCARKGPDGTGSDLRNDE